MTAYSDPEEGLVSLTTLGMYPTGAMSDRTSIGQARDMTSPPTGHPRLHESVQLRARLAACSRLDDDAEADGLASRALGHDLANCGLTSSCIRGHATTSQNRIRVGRQIQRAAVGHSAPLPKIPMHIEHAPSVWPQPRDGPHLVFRVCRMPAVDAQLRVVIAETKVC